ncbi:MAG: type I phosphomannose isomerase catalytic subunit [Pontiella sp.]
MHLYPLKFKPVYKDYPWGNTRLPAMFDREAPEGIYAESWEVSTHPDGESVVANGAFSGKTLSQVLAEAGAEILGTSVEGTDFPLLIKLIDAAQPLSVQVHPNNGNAEEVQGEPKTEMWYFLNEEPSQIYCGLKQGTTRADFMKAIEDESFEEILHAVPAEKGGAAFVPGGRVHAIDAGCLILEIQQNSNTTYRVYDWGRVGNDGQPRELHVDKALQVIDFEDTGNPVCTPTDTGSNIRNICSSDYFILEELLVEKELTQVADGSTFHVLFSADGAFKITYADGSVEDVAKGTSILIPASLGRYSLSAEGCIVLKTSVPTK